MKKYIGGYSILDLASTTIYADALGALNQDKPVLVYDLPDVYYADTIKATTIDGDDVIQITKGGKTITINDVNAVSSEGDIQPHLYQYLITSSKEGYTFNCEVLSKDNVNITTYDELLLLLGNKTHLASGIGDEGDGSIIVSIKVTNTNTIEANGYEVNSGVVGKDTSVFDVLDIGDFDLITITKTQLF